MDAFKSIATVGADPVPAPHLPHPPSPEGDPAVFTLRRTGRRPLRFQGWQLVEASGHVAGVPVWHELNLFQTQAGAIVTELVIRRPGLKERDLNRVTVHDDLSAAAGWLEEQDPVADIPPSVDLDGGGGMAAAAFQIVALRQLCGRVERDYRALVADVLYALGIVDTADAAAGRSS